MTMSKQRLNISKDGDPIATLGNLCQRLTTLPVVPAGTPSLFLSTESLDHLGWKRPLSTSGPTFNLELPSPPLNYVIYTS